MAASWTLPLTSSSKMAVSTPRRTTSKLSVMGTCMCCISLGHNAASRCRALSSNAPHAMAGLAEHSVLNLCLQHRSCHAAQTPAYIVFRYKALEEQCNIDKEKRYVVTIDGHEDVPGFDEGALVKVGQLMNLPPLASGNLLQSTGLGWAKKKCCHCNCYCHTVAYTTEHHFSHE